MVKSFSAAAYFLRAKKGPSQIFGALKCPLLCLQNWKAALCSPRNDLTVHIRTGNVPFFVLLLQSADDHEKIPFMLRHKRSLPVVWVRQWRHLVVKLYIVALTPVAGRVWEYSGEIWMLTMTLCSVQSCSSSEQCIVSPTHRSPVCTTYIPEMECGFA